VGYNVAKDILPDCRAVDTKGRVFTLGGVWIPVYCANCGVDGGMVPEENMTFVFYLCQKCAETHGPIAGMMMMPDEVFFEKLKQEQIASYGKYLTEQELLAIVEAGDSPLATLINDEKRRINAAND
jgi:hypothetical protein